MRKITKKELYSQITRGSTIGILLSGVGFCASALLLDISDVPVIASTLCATATTLSAYISSCKEQMIFIKENKDKMQDIQTMHLIKELEYHIKDAKKAMNKEEKYFTDAQSKIINYALDDDVLGLKEYVNSEEFCEDLEEYKFDNSYDIDIPKGSNVIKFKKRKR